jgi:hypothetical protein
MTLVCALVILNLGIEVPIIPAYADLVVEDSAVDRKVGGYLKDWGLDHIIVGTGKEAAETWPSPIRRPWRCWIGCCLAGWDRALPVIRALSVWNLYLYRDAHHENRKQDLLTAMEAGADDYLSKPVNAMNCRRGFWWENGF